MDKLVSDRAQLEVSKKVKDNLRHLCIDDWQSEAQFQHHKFAELRYQETKFIYLIVQVHLLLLGFYAWNVCASF